MTQLIFRPPTRVAYIVTDGRRLNTPVLAFESQDDADAWIAARGVELHPDYYVETIQFIPSSSPEPATPETPRSGSSS